jgi:hypothetical protein
VSSPCRPSRAKLTVYNEVNSGSTMKPISTDFSLGFTPGHHRPKTRRPGPGALDASARSCGSLALKDSQSHDMEQARV